MIAVMEAEDARDVILVGHSMGGPVSLLVAAARADRVRAVVGVDTLHDAEFEFEPEQWGDLIAQFEADFHGTCQRFARSMFTSAAEPRLVLQVEARMCDAPPEIAIALLETFPLFDMRAALCAVNVPVRSINAPFPFPPTEVEKNRQYHADYDALIVKDVGHFLMLERPDDFNAALRLILETLDL